MIDESLYKPDFAKSAKLAPNQSIELEIRVEQAQNFGVTFMAAPNVSATLYNEQGEIVGKNLAHTPESSVWFRSIYVDKNITAGKWKLKLENTGAFEAEAVIAAWHDAGRS